MHYAAAASDAERKDDDELDKEDTMEALYIKLIGDEGSDPSLKDCVSTNQKVVAHATG